MIRGAWFHPDLTVSAPVYLHEASTKAWLAVYSHLCTGNPLIGGSPVAANDTAARTGPRIRSRELTDSGCIYGLPDIAKTSPFTVIGLQSPLWPILAFITAGVLRLWMRSPS